MSRMGKKTLYLDLEAVDRLQAALIRLPGRPSVSSFLTEMLPQHAEQMEKMADALETGGVRALAGLYLGVGHQLLSTEIEVVKMVEQAKEKGILDYNLVSIPPEK